MSKFNKPYNPKEVEDRIYRLWEESGFFNPDNLPATKSSKLKAKSFCIIMPPPNANGSLHMGHALFVTLEDLMIRYKRMCGFKTLWLPGADHAGFETQVVFDKKLEKEGRNRFEIPRDELYKEIWDFTQKNKKVMEGQLRKLGASCDWSREKFTLDKDIIHIVYDTFKKLYDDGLIYRDLRVINWCTKHQTALSDLEVKYIEREDPLYYIKYGPLVLATVRPETKFGDTALAVNPKDKRYQKYIGKEVEAQGLLGKLKFKIVADEAVDPHFGTGVVKVTPAHDPADFEIWQRHKNEIPGPKSIIDERGQLTPQTGKYQGLKVTEAREKVAEDMEKIGILEKIVPGYKHNVATCYKCGTTLEPLLRPQWFIKMTVKPKSGGDSLREAAVKAVKSSKIKFIPKRFEKVFFHWMKNLRDWNISRQITWGIRIPAWYCVSCSEPKINPKIKGSWFLVRHGQTDWNVERRLPGQSGDAPLNETGKTQARTAAEQLHPFNIDLVISSDLARARETAEIIGRELNAEVVFDAALRERSYGVFEGKTLAELEREYGYKTGEDDYVPDGGENLDDLGKRVYEALLRHKDKHHHKNIAIVSHGAAIKGLLRRLKGVSWEELRHTKIHHALPIHFSLSDACKKCGSDVLEQDPDVFDTWFSSGQWPFATLLASSRSNLKFKNPARGEARQRRQKSKLRNDFKEFYPTDVMETGWDILFFWVARMIMLGIYRTGKIPFRTVYLHGLVRDKDRQKMSKSKGNVIDPLGVAEIYGSDAVRMALIMGTTPGNDPIISEDKIRGYRNFATKIWNVARFVMMNHDPKFGKIKPKFNTHDKKHLKELKIIRQRITKDMDEFKFHQAAFTVYHYFWHTFADKIIEASKLRLRSENTIERATAFRINLEILKTCLKLLHPFMPFITEEIYQRLPNKDTEFLMTADW